MKRAREDQGGETAGVRCTRGKPDGQALSSQMPATLPACAVAERVSGNALPGVDAPKSGNAEGDPVVLSERQLDSSSHCEGSCDNSCGEDTEEEGCSGCADMKLQERQLQEQRRLMAALHSRNCMLTALNSNLVMQLNLLRSTVPLERREARSMHLRIALPGEYAVEPAQPSKDEKGTAEDTSAAGPMLHIWVNSDMAVETVRQNMHNFVAAPTGQDWYLSLMKGGVHIEDAATPDSLQLDDGHLMFASLRPEQQV